MPGGSKAPGGSDDRNHGGRSTLVEALAGTVILVIVALLASGLLNGLTPL